MWDVVPKLGNSSYYISESEKVLFVNVELQNKINKNIIN